MNRLNSITTRMGPDLLDSIEAMPGLGGVALWVKFIDSDNPPKLVAQTDGIHVEAGPAYENYDAAERRFIILHELLHVALAHPARSREMERRTANFDGRLYNICCDAIINKALEGVSGIKIIHDSINIGDLLDKLDWDIVANPANLLLQWSSESLYHLLAKNRDQAKPEANPESKRNSGFDGEDIVQAINSNNSNNSNNNKSNEDEIRDWNSRLKMARGALPEIFNRLVNELPKVKTPWERILRDFLFRHARGKRRPDPAWPSRRWLALEADLKDREGVDLPFDRAVRCAKRGRIALAVDTSGSIDDKILKRFASEVAAILEKTDPLLRMIVCDAEVHQVQDFSGGDGAKLLRSFKFEGGGGTDFKPAIARAAEWKPDVMLYLTDLLGEAGNEPAFPFLWVIPNAMVKAPPWGKLVYIS